MRVRVGVVPDIEGETIDTVCLCERNVGHPVIDGEGGGKADDVVGDNDLGDVGTSDFGGCGVLGWSVERERLSTVPPRFGLRFNFALASRARVAPAILVQPPISASSYDP